MICLSFTIFPQVGDEFGFPYETDLDGEAILHLYARGGVEYAAAMCDGVFAFCIVDTATKQVLTRSLPSR